MTKEQEAGVREALIGIDPVWVEEAIARCRELHDDADITIATTIATTISVRIADQVVATRELERQNGISERSALARDATYGIAMDVMNRLDDDPIVH